MNNIYQPIINQQTPKHSLSSQIIHSIKLSSITIGLLLAVILISLFLVVSAGLLLNSDPEAINVVATGIGWIIVTLMICLWIAPAFKLQFNFGQISWLNFGLCLATWVASIFTIGAVTQVLLPILLGYDNQVTNTGEYESHYYIQTSVVFSLTLFFVIAIIVPIVEEILFRAILYQGLRQKLKFIPAVIVSSLVFGVLHGYGQPTWQAVLILIAWATLFGVMLAVVYEKTKLLLNSIMIHIFQNSFATLIAIIFAQ